MSFDPTSLPAVQKVLALIQGFESWIMTVVLLALYLLFLAWQAISYYWGDDQDREQIKRRIKGGTGIVIGLQILVGIIEWFL